MADRVLRTDWKRIGRSGKTTDGREIKPEWLTQMAESYNKELFTALIWPEHARYANYGTVEALRTTKNDEGGIDLWAILSPNSIYQSSNSYGQKLFTSMEISFDFRKTGAAYLTGLGATDDPASVGTSEIRFSKLAEQAGMQLSAFIEAETQTFTDQQPNTLLDQIKALFKNQPSEDADMADKAALEKLSTEVAELKGLFAKLLPPTDDKKPEDKPVKKTELAAQFAALQKSHDELLEKFNALQKPEDKAPEKSEIDVLKESFAALQAKLDEALKEQPGTEGGEHFGANEKAETYL